MVIKPAANIVFSITLAPDVLARVEKLAVEQGICRSEWVRHSVIDSLRFQELKEAELK